MGLFDLDGDLTSKSQSPYRWVVLILACLMMIGSYYCYDEPAALKTQIDEYMGKPSNYETLYSLLYTVYAVPNVILPFFGGYFVDKFSARNCSVVFASFILCGNILFAIGMNMKLWWLMYLGRILHGCGGPSLCVASSALLAQWFTGKELAFAFGLNLSLCRLGSVINNLVSPRVTESSSVVAALWVGVIICAISVGCACAILPIDRSIDAIIQQNIRQPLLARSAIHSDTVVNPMDNTEDDKMNNETSIRYSKDGVYEPVAPSEGDTRESNDVSITAIREFSILFWMLCLLCVFVYGCVFPFNNVASTLLLERNYFMEQPNSQCALKWDYKGACQNATNQPNHYCNNGEWYQPPVAIDADIDCDNDPHDCYKDYCDGESAGAVQATTVMSIPYIIVACLCPFMGKFVDIYGLRAIIMTAATLMLFLVHLLIGFSRIDPIILLVGQGLAYCSFAAVLWPSISIVLQPKYLGLGYGFVFAIQNTGLAVFPLIIATIYTDSNDMYIPNVEIFFMCIAFIAFLLGCTLNYLDNKYHYGFNSASGKPLAPNDSEKVEQ